MNQTVLFAFEHQRVRTVFIVGVVWFVAADVCKVLGLDNVTRAVDRLEDDDKTVLPAPQGVISSNPLWQGKHSGGRQPLTVISEAGVIELILTSRKPEARRFKHWLTHEVVPMIRRYGYYAPKRKPMSQSRMLIEAKALCEAEFERRRPDGAVALSERQFCASLGEKILTEYPEMLMPIVTKAAHDWLYHPNERARAGELKEHDPDQPELFTHYSVLADGRERWVPRDVLSREETTGFLARYAKMREAWRNLIHRSLRHDKAFLADFNRRNSNRAITAEEVAVIAPDLDGEAG